MQYYKILEKTRMSLVIRGGCQSGGRFRVDIRSGVFHNDGFIEFYIDDVSLKNDLETNECTQFNKQK